MLDHQLICGDADESIDAIETSSVHLIVTDPPYNLGKDYGCGSTADRLPSDEYLSFCQYWINNCVRVLRRDGSFWLLMREQFADNIGIMLSNMMHRRNRIIWREKFAQYCEGKFPGGHRHLFYHVADLGNYTWNTDDIRVESERMKMNDKRAAGPRVPDDVWDVSVLQGNCKERVGWHPCQLRQWPIERIILATSNPGDTVLDPFIGSGTTLRACIATGRRCIGIDKNPDYISRIQKEIAGVKSNS